MSNTSKETSFSALSERIVGAHERPADRISVSDYIVDVEIGAFQLERDMTQRLRFSVVVEVAPSKGAETDDVDDILSYDAVTEAIDAELAAERLNLLETLAERICARLLREPQPLRVFIRIEKLDRGPFVLGVELVRVRDQISPTATDVDVSRPRLICLGNSAISSDKLPLLLDALQRSDAPVVLAVGRGATAAPNTGDADTQRWVDLLAVGQNALVLAARDRRIKVVDTRTELDWGMKHGQLSVWAPAKMVLDAVDGPLDVSDVALMDWIYTEILAVDRIDISDETALEAWL